VEVSEPLPLPEDSEVEKTEAELIPEDKVKNGVEDLKFVGFCHCFGSIRIRLYAFLLPDAVKT
jgi:hypothetical protein